MNNKLFIFIVGIPLVLFITVGGYFLWDVSRPIQPQEISSVGPEDIPPIPPPESGVVAPPSSPPIWKDPASPSSPIPVSQPTPPAPQKIIIPVKKTGDVPVNNFYKDTETQVFNMNKDAVIKDEPQYKIIYYTVDQSFFIFLLGGDLKTVRTTAEQELLKKIGVAENQACGLRVSVMIDAGVNDGGVDYKLSFCPNGKPLP